LDCRDTIERDFGWVFFYGLSDSSIKVAGNSPFIVDRKEGAIHVTGTAFPLERYLESYDRVGWTYPFAVAEHLVILDGWKAWNAKSVTYKANSQWRQQGPCRGEVLYR
jgi:hypothetical protein